MRIIALISLSFLAGCAAGTPVGEAPKNPRGLADAQAHCLAKGYDRTSFDYDVCYKNRPEVQAHERTGRIGTMNILNTNRSPHTYKGRSYPVE